MTALEAGAFTAYVSPEDSALEAESWYVNSRGYVVNNGGGRANAAREVVWFSPHCINPMETLPLFCNGKQ